MKLKTETANEAKKIVYKGELSVVVQCTCI